LIDLLIDKSGDCESL